MTNTTVDAMTVVQYKLYAQMTKESIGGMQNV